MSQLVIDTRGGDWHAVKAYAEARRAELLETLDDLMADDQARRDAAVRRDELALLLAAPGETAEAKARQETAAQNHMRTY